MNNTCTTGDARLAVIIPAYNEETTIVPVIREFREAFPEAKIVVCDNRSTDRTAELAKAEDAVVIRQEIPGKGAALRKAVKETDADIYILTDADTTYPACDMKDLVKDVKNGFDMAIGDRRKSYMKNASSPVKKIGNSLFPLIFRILYGCPSYDVLSGGRVISADFADLCAFKENGFNTEVEMDAFAVRNGMKIAQRDIGYRERPEGSKSKLNAVKDGAKIILAMFRHRFSGKAKKAASFAGALAAILLMCSCIPVSGDPAVQAEDVAETETTVQTTEASTEESVPVTPGTIQDVIDDQDIFLHVDNVTWDDPGFTVTGSCENRSDKTLTFAVSGFCVNDWTVRAPFSEDIAPGDVSHFELSPKDGALDDVGVTDKDQISEIGLDLWVYDTKEPSAPSVAEGAYVIYRNDEADSPETKSGEPVVDNEYVSAQIADVKASDDGSLAVELLCENRTERAASFAVFAAELDGIPCDPLFSEKVNENSRKSTKILWDKDTLAAAGIAADGVKKIRLIIDIRDRYDMLADPYFNGEYVIDIR